MTVSPGRVVVWRNEWLPQSNTFIRDQLRSLPTWQGSSAAWFRLENPLTEPDAYVFRQGRLGEIARRRLPARSHVALAARQVARLRPDLIHAHFGTDAVMARDVARRIGVPLAVTFHGYDVTALQHDSRPGYETSLRTVLHDVDLLIAVSGFIRDRLLELGAPPDRTVVHHTGVPTPAVHPTLTGRRGVVFVGRLVEKKGVNDLLRCYAALPRELRDEHPLTIIGDGPLDTELRRLDDELDTSATFTGSISSDEVGRHLAAGAVACVPSKTAASGDSEGLPTVILEAFARGTAVVASRHSGSPEAVHDGRTGLLFDEGDGSGLVAGLEALLTNAPRREQLAAAANDLVRREFDIVTQTGRLEELYQRARTTTRTRDVSPTQPVRPLRVFYSGTVVSNGGDAAIHLAQHRTVVTTFGPVAATMADSAPDVAAELFPDARQVEPIWRYEQRGQWRYPRLTPLWRRLLTARMFAAARLPAWLGAGLVSNRERTTFSALRAADLVVYSGGTTLIEKYDVEPKLLELAIASRLGTPIVLMPASMGPFEAPTNRRRMRQLLNEASLVICRDERSLGYLQDLGPTRGTITVAPDIVFAMTRPQAAARLREPAELRKVVISVRDIRRFAARPGAGEQYLAAMAAVATALVEQDGVTVEFLSTCQGIDSYALDDSAMAVEVARRLSPAVRDRVVVDRARHTPAQLQDAFADADLVIATRMHAAILAITVGTPVLPIAYEFKTHEVFGQLGVGSLVLDADALTGQELVTARHTPLTPAARQSVADGLEQMGERMARVEEHLFASVRIPKA